jgi:hypothetical protein
MTPAKSPGALAALGASEIDQLGGKVDQENSLSSLAAQLPLRAGNASRCLVCGSTINPRRASRRQRHCSYHCRDEARRARNFAASGATRRGSQAIPRSVENQPLVSASCEGGFAGRASSIIGPQILIETEIVAGRIWKSVVSADGVTCEVTQACRNPHP